MAEAIDNTPDEVGDPDVPTELLDLHVELEDSGMTPEDFRKVFGDGSDN